MKFKYNTENSSSKKKGYTLRRGFTMVELLISMAITLIIVAMLLGMTKISIDAWRTTNSKAKSSRLAQEVFDVVGRDMEGIVIRTGNNFEWLRIVSSNLADEDLGPDTNKTIKNALEFNFFTSTPDRYDGQIGVAGVDNGGDVSLVRYRLVYQDAIDPASRNKPVYSLYRDRVEPDTAFNNLLAQTNLETGLTAITESISDEENLLADNIYDFTLSFNFEFITSTGEDGYQRVVMQSEGVNNQLSIQGNEIQVNGGALPLPAGATSLRLSSADISVFVISDSGMKSVATVPIANDGEFSEFLNEHGNTYTKSVILPQP